jgi:hypothetical protein
MICEKCGEATRKLDKQFYFRFENANILVIGCEHHVGKVLDIVRDHQANKQQKGGE